MAFEGILESKQGLTELDLFHKLPPEFRAFFEHCRTLAFDGKPNYDHISLLFDNLLVKEGFQGDMAFDWETNLREEVLKIMGDVSLHGHGPSYKCCML